MKKSIRNRLIYTFGVILFITVFTFELLFTFGVNSYYYSNIEQVLTDKLETTLEIYETYLGYESLGYTAKFILENETVPDYVEAQVLDLSGNVLESTAYYIDRELVGTECRFQRHFIRQAKSMACCVISLRLKRLVDKFMNI